MNSNKSLNIITLSSFCMGLLGCANQTQDIRPTYVSPVNYQNYSCKEISSEWTRVSNKINELSVLQDKKASQDAAAVGVGLILWPGLFLISHNDYHVELGQLKGQSDALEQAANKKGCSGIVKEKSSPQEPTTKDNKPAENKPIRDDRR